jgi:hypothetical protein
MLHKKLAGPDERWQEFCAKLNRAQLKALSTCQGCAGTCHVRQGNMYQLIVNPGVSSSFNASIYCNRGGPDGMNTEVRLTAISGTKSCPRFVSVASLHQPDGITHIPTPEDRPPAPHSP